MTPFERFHRTVEAALEKHLNDLFDYDDAHERFCLCNECVCVRGVRDELESYAKRAAKKKRQGGPTFDDILFAPEKRQAVERAACAMEQAISWTGCPAELACLNYRNDPDEDEPRPTALCRACSRASVKKKRGKAK